MTFCIIKTIIIIKILTDEKYSYAIHMDEGMTRQFEAETDTNSNDDTM